MPAGPIALWRRATLTQALTVHVIATLSAGVWDAVVADETATWTTVSLVVCLLIEALFVWRLWARGRVVWWIGLVLQAFALAVGPVVAVNPTIFEYPAGTHPLEMLPLLLLTGVGVAVWVAPSVRRHVQAVVPAGSS